MKKLIICTLPFLGAILMFNSCKKDEKQVVLDTSNTAVHLTASATTIVLAHSDSTKTALVLSWDTAKVNYSAPFDYSIEFSKTSTFNDSIVDISISNGSHALTYLTPALNDYLVNNVIKDTTPSTHNIYVRIKAQLRQLNAVSSGSTPTVVAESVYSNVIQLTVTTYHYVPPGGTGGIVLPTGYRSFYVPGAYQGWAPDKADSIGSTDSKAFEGYVMIGGSDQNFKFTSAKDWNHTNYGDSTTATYTTTGNVTTGHVSTDGSAGNLKVPASDYYQLKLDLPSKVWTATVTHWSVIGDAPTTGTAWSTDFPMVYDPATQTLSVTLALTGGKSFKFRANNDWGINFGLRTSSNGTSSNLDYNSSTNLPVPAANGNYKIVLDLSHPLVYLYTITKVP